jgi:F0F1-type ATP synthase membrane subunit b/b'
MMLAEEVSELWLWPNFLILVGLLGYLAKKHGGPFFAARSQQLREGLEAGKKAQAEAEKVAAGVRAKLATLDSEIANLKVSAQAELERETQRIQQHTAAELDSLGKRTTIELRHYAASLAMDLAEQKVRARMTPALQSGLIEGFAADLSREAVQGGVAAQ